MIVTNLVAGKALPRRGFLLGSALAISSLAFIGCSKSSAGDDTDGRSAQDGMLLIPDEDGYDEYDVEEFGPADSNVMMTVDADESWNVAPLGEYGFEVTVNDPDGSGSSRGETVLEGTVCYVGGDVDEVERLNRDTYELTRYEGGGMVGFLIHDPDDLAAELGVADEVKLFFADHPKGLMVRIIADTHRASGDFDLLGAIDKFKFIRVSK